MLKTYRIIPLAFILFLFGLILIPVSLVSADEHAAFAECEQMQTQPNNYESLKWKKNSSLTAIICGQAALLWPTELPPLPSIPLKYS